MDPFLLSVESRPDGTTHMTFDIGPTSRANVLMLTENAHITLGVSAQALLAGLLSSTRPPDRRRAHR